MFSKAHGHNFYDALAKENDCEYQISLFKRFIPAWLVGWVVVFFILFWGKQNGVQDDAKSYETVKPAVNHYYNAQLTN